MFLKKNIFPQISAILTLYFQINNVCLLTKNTVDDLIESLEQAFSSLFGWFKNNLLKIDSDKCHILVSPSD